MVPCIPFFLDFKVIKQEDQISTSNSNCACETKSHYQSSLPNLHYLACVFQLNISGTGALRINMCPPNGAKPRRLRWLLLPLTISCLLKSYFWVLLCYKGSPQQVVPHVWYGTRYFTPDDLSDAKHICVCLESNQPPFICCLVDVPFGPSVILFPKISCN